MMVCLILPGLSSTLFGLPVLCLCLCLMMMAISLIVVSMSHYVGPSATLFPESTALCLRLSESWPPEGALALLKVCWLPVYIPFSE